MRPARVTRANISPDRSDTTLWMDVDVSSWPLSEVDRFKRLKAAILDYLAWKSMKQIKLWHQVSSEQVLEQLARCTTPADDGRIKGWRGLIKHARVKNYERRQVKEVWTGKAGLSGSFTRLLNRYPVIALKLRDFILKKPSKRDRIQESGISFQGIFDKFLSLCIECHIPLDEYPFCTPSQASGSVRKFAHAVRKANFAAGAKLIGGEVGESRAAAGTGLASLLTAERPYDTFQMDEHRLDFIGGVRMLTPAGYQLIPISRLVLVLIADMNMQCVVGYHVAIRKEASAEEIVMAVSQCLTRWKPRQLVTDHLRYKQGAGLPSGVIPELEGACAAELMLDNSMAHWSDAMVTRIRQRTGMAINWGPIAYWVRRSVVERIFGILEKRGFQRLISTTGSHPRDVRKQDPVGKAIKHQIELEELLDLIDVIIANFNASGSAALGGRSPLEALLEFVSMSTFGFLPRQLPELPSHIPDMTVVVEKATIRGSQGQTVVRQYVEKFLARYTSPVLSAGAMLINRKVTLHLNPLDPRTAKAFFEDGAELGILTAMGVWGIKPHTMEMRKEIQRLIRLNKLEICEGDDEISAFNRHLHDKAVKSASAKGRAKISPDATKLAHYASATGVPITAPTPPCSAPSAIATQPPVSFPTGEHRPAKELNWPSFLPRPDFKGKAR